MMGRGMSLGEPPFRLTGYPWFSETGRFERIPASLLPGFSPVFHELAACTSGGTARVITDARELTLTARLRFDRSDMNAMSRTGHSGFDFYLRREGGTPVHLPCRPEFTGDRIVSRLTLPEDIPAGAYELLILFPLYNGVEEPELLLPEGSGARAPEGEEKLPILFYGSSITQGGNASRPGCCYVNRLSLALSRPVVNFGFSGSAMGEPGLAELIGGLALNAVVLDYDHNAPDIGHLRLTHEPFFRVIRAAQPSLPVVMLSKCDFGRSLDDNGSRREVVRRTFENAKRDGDRNVYFVDGEEFFGELRDHCTVDGVHPNDLGFHRMAGRLEPLLRSLEKRE